MKNRFMIVIWEGFPFTLCLVAGFVMKVFKHWEVYEYEA